jgi:hypothetical protein
VKNKLIIQLGNKKIVAEIYDNNGPEIPPELCVFLEDEDGTIIQDICLVRPHYDINRKTKEFETDADFVDCLVWGDSDDEDYTDKFVIGIHEWEED